jgi:hypothetical protein
MEYAFLYGMGNNGFPNMTRRIVMFTTTELNVAKCDILQKRGTTGLYTHQKSEVSFDLSIMSPLDRGVTIEKMIVNRMVKSGVDAAHMGGSGHDCDLSLYVGGKIVRGECKSSLLGPQSGKYYFQGVKPEMFDILFLAFVHPTMGVVVKSVGVKSIRQWVKEYSPKRKVEGYDIYFRGDMTNGKISTIEWDPSGEGARA